MKNSKFRSVAYWTVLLLNVGVLLLSLYIIIPEIGREINYSFFKDYHIGYGIGIVMLYTITTLALSLLSLLILPGKRRWRVVLICLTSNLFFISVIYLINNL